MDLLDTARTLGYEAGRLRFGPPVRYVYNPLDYAWHPHAQYLRRFGQGRREVLLVGMNPGPWGMAQTGVPFGDVAMVRGWLGIEAPVHKPAQEHPKRPVDGFACRRREVSGQRLWGWARDRFGTPEHFFSRFFLANYCPLCFLEESGRNRTPDRLRAAERQDLFAVCDSALRQVVRHFRPHHVLGVGRFAEGRVADLLEGSGIALGGVPHPSPANPAANRGWSGAMEKALRRNGITLP